MNQAISNQAKEKRYLCAIPSQSLLLLRAPFPLNGMSALCTTDYCTVVMYGSNGCVCCIDQIKVAFLCATSKVCITSVCRQALVVQTLFVAEASFIVIVICM